MCKNFIYISDSGRGDEISDGMQKITLQYHLFKQRFNYVGTFSKVLFF